MNKLINTLMFCFFLCILYACGDKNTEEELLPYFDVEESELTQLFAGETDVKYMTVKTNREFIVVSSEPSWCGVEVVDDKIDNIKISVTENKKAVERTAQITISSVNFADIIVTVKQNWIASIITDKAYVLLSNDELKFSLNITSNIEYELKLPDWIKEINHQLDGSYEFESSAISPGERSGEIVIRAEDESYNIKTTVAVIQREYIKKVGSWLFDDSQNLTHATIGADLETVINTAYKPDAEFLSVEGPTSNNKAVRVPLNCYFLANHGMIPKENENYISEYTLFYEFRIPVIGRFYSLFQTNLDNTGDAEIFIRNANPPTIGVGATGYGGGGLIKAEQWHRLYLSFKPGDVKFFLDGELFHTSNTSDSRFRVDLEGIILCGGPWAKKDDNEFDLAEITIWNGALTLDQVQELEGVE